MLGVPLYTGSGLMLSRAHTAIDAQGQLTDENAQKMLRALLAGFAAFVQAQRRS